MLENTLPAGHVLDKRYKISKLIEAGGMGAVYKAEDLCVDNRIVAVKEMLDDFSTPEERRAGIDRFLSEIAVLETFRHPNIPKVMDHFFLEQDKDRLYYFVMEFIDGIDLSSYLKKYGDPGLPEQQVIKYAIQVCEALEYIHGFDPPVAHRDIKPSNLLYRYDDKRILLIDFGIARVTNPGEGYWIGTPGYAPPEQQMGKPEPRSDFYALAATMHELLTGHRPEDFDFPSFEELGVKVSPELTEFITVSLSFEPEDRAVNATEMKDFLMGLLQGELGVGPLSPDFVFEQVIHQFKQEHLDALLKKLIDKYGNEAHTKFIPKRLDYYTFRLAYPTNFELIIQVNYKDRRIHFYEKQGILEKKELGTINPANSGEAAEASRLINRFTQNYEKFKSVNWGGGEGFMSFGNIVGV
ncbi:MAG: serine/threonine protein kinase [Vulcanimicrobiota bacterium]